MHIVTKNIKKLLQQLSDMLPQVQVHSTEKHYLMGKEILGWGTITEIDGLPINADETYVWNYPVITLANHYRRLKWKYQKGGIDGIKNYLNWINSLVKEDKMKNTMQALMLLIKTIEEKK